jgi:hypothetical protein
MPASVIDEVSDTDRFFRPSVVVIESIPSSLDVVLVAPEFVLLFTPYEPQGRVRIVSGFVGVPIAHFVA